MKRFVVIITVLTAMLLAVDVAAVGRQPRREAQQEVPVIAGDGIEIYGNNGAITVKSDHKATVRVFTILGQLVSTTAVQPGTTRIKVPARGIYIIKVDNITKKVAL